MSTFSSLEIGLSFLCGCVLLGCAAQVYYLLWWKKRNIDIENQKSSFSSCSSNYTLSYSLCWKNHNFTKPTKTQENNQDPSMGSVKDQVFIDSEEESLDLELMRLHNLHGPPRFLTTINEETKEDLESQRSRRCSRTRSLSDLAAHFDTTPQASPPIKGSQLLNLGSCQFHQNGLNSNPLFEIDVNKVKSSPPPTFKFLRDAEEKLLRRLMALEGEKKEVKNDGSFAKMSASKNHGTAASKVIPLASSPTNS